MPVTRALALVGFKKSGKTTTTLALARRLGELGMRVAVAKSSHHGLDKTDTDTDKLLGVAGSVIFISPEETALLWPRFTHLPDLIPLLDADILLVEGGKSLGWLPRVLLLHDTAEADSLEPGLALATFGGATHPDMPHLQHLDALADLAMTRGFLLPGLDCGACGKADCAEMAEEIVAGRQTPDACTARRMEVTVTVNGQPLATGPFVGRLMAGTLRGMLAELKGYTPGARVHISLDG
ncbi:MAG: molybdopterin-guanine dinucleotide biosynthesis protein MobB [Desulfovibrio sp.]|nr:molybdopterin-guanine dinucleotide biosynthesis protein MobB [Desulfovibrio sp.]